VIDVVHEDAATAGVEGGAGDFRALQSAQLAFDGVATSSAR